MHINTLNIVSKMNPNKEMCPSVSVVQSKYQTFQIHDTKDHGLEVKIQNAIQTQQE